MSKGGMDNSTIVEMVLGGLLGSLGYLLREKDKEIKEIRKNSEEADKKIEEKFDNMNGKMYQFKNDGVAAHNAVKNKVDLIEMEVKNDISSIKEMHTLQFNQINTEMLEIKESIKETNAQFRESNSLTQQLIAEIKAKKKNGN